MIKHNAIAMFVTAVLASSAVQAQVGAPEKEELKLGFIKLTDMAPLAIAYEKGYFEDEGLYVTLEAQANWKVLLDRVITGELDGGGSRVESAAGAAERTEMLSALTTNVTHFFREMHHFDLLRQSVLPPLLAAARKGGRLRIWSAGCSCRRCLPCGGHYRRSQGAGLLGSRHQLFYQNLCRQMPAGEPAAFDAGPKQPIATHAKSDLVVPERSCAQAC